MEWYHKDKEAFPEEYTLKFCKEVNVSHKVRTKCSQTDPLLKQRA